MSPPFTGLPYLRHGATRREASRLTVDGFVDEVFAQAQAEKSHRAVPLLLRPYGFHRGYRMPLAAAGVVT